MDGSEKYEVGINYLKKVSEDLYEYEFYVIDIFDTAEKAKEFQDKLSAFVSVATRLSET